ncbi:hypothetical protein WN943_020441 [Citrus x changshan-huyou]
MDSSKITANTSSLSSLMEDSKQQERVPSLLNMLRTTLSISGLPRCLKRLLEGIKHVPEPCCMNILGWKTMIGRGTNKPPPGTLIQSFDMFYMIFKTIWIREANL